MARGRGGCQGIGFALKKIGHVGGLGGERVAISGSRGSLIEAMGV